MNKIDEIKAELTEFINCDKFKVYQHLQPAVANSSENDKKFINNEMNLCANELLQQLTIEQTKDKDLKKIIRNSITRIEDAMLDTEDREFCYEVYWKLGEKIGVDIEDKSKSIEQKLMEDIQRLMKKGGLNPNDFFPFNS